MVPLSYLAEFLAVCVWQECFQRLEPCVDALHAAPLVTIGDLPADTPLLVLSSLRAERDVGQTEGRDDGEKDRGKWRQKLHFIQIYCSLVCFSPRV